MILLLQLVEVMLAEFGHFRRDDGAAVGLRAVVLEIFLVVVLGHIKVRRGRKLGYDWIPPNLGRVQRRDRLLGAGFLLGRTVKDRRAILSAHIGTLPVQRGRVVDGEEDIEEILKRDHLPIKRDLNSLGVPGVAIADLAVARVDHTAAGVAGFDMLDALELIVDRFQAPEAAAGQRSDFGCMR